MKAGWEVKTLGEVTVLENGDRGKNYPGRKAFVTSGVPFINAGHISDGKIDWAEMNYIPEEHFQRLSRGKITKDDLLFCLRGSLGKFGHVTEDVMGAIASSLVIIRATSKIDVNFLKQFLGSAACAEEIEKYAAGAAQPNLGATDLKKFKIPLPPLAEQKRIVSILDEAFEGLDRARENAEANLKSARELFESTLNSALSIHHDDQLKAGWKVQTIGDVTVLENGDRGKNYPGRKAFVSSGVAFINAGHIAGGKIDWAQMNYIPEEHFQRISRGKIVKDDLLFCLRGSLGKFGHVTEDFKGAIASSLVIIRTTMKIDVNFLKHFLDSAHCTEEIEKYAGGAAQPNLGASDLKKFTIPVPPLDEQKRIVSDLDRASRVCTDLQTHYTTKLLDISDLRQSLLQKAFAGELT